ncbi:hypothetical protein Tco_0695872 [Tanacetum coccineum]
MEGAPEVHPSAKVGRQYGNRVSCQEGAEGNAVRRKKMRSKKTTLRNLLKYKAWLTSRSRFEVSALDEELNIRCLLCAVNVTRLGFHDSSASSAVVCFFRGCLLLRDASLYLLCEACETWTLLGLSSSD